MLLLLSRFSRVPTLCDPRDGSPPGSPVPGILQARTLEWAAISFSNAWKWKVKVKSLSSCPTLSDPMDCSLPGSSVHGIFQARVLEWGAIDLSKIYRWHHPYSRKWRRTKEPLDESERGEWKAGLKLNIQKTKTMTSSPVTSWQIDGETMEMVRNFFGGL